MPKGIYQRKPLIQRRGIYKKCTWCNKTFYVPQSLSGVNCCSVSCASLYRFRVQKQVHPALNRIPSKKTRRKMRLAKLGRRLSALHKLRISRSERGNKHYNWQGGKTRERTRLMQQREYKLWRKSVFERDNYTCRDCNVRGVYLEAHHIKTWAEYHKLRYDINNGRTLCLDCHKKITKHQRIKAKKLELHNAENTTNRNTIRETTGIRVKGA